MDRKNVLIVLFISGAFPGNAPPWDDWCGVLHTREGMLARGWSPESSWRFPNRATNSTNTCRVHKPDEDEGIAHVIYCIVGNFF